MTENDRALKLLNEGRILDAIPILRNLAWRSPSYKAYINLSSALRYAGEFDSAIQYLTRAVRLDAAAPNAWMALANISTDVGDWDHALKYYEGALFRVSNGGHLLDGGQAQRQVALGLAQALLRNHDFQAAWPLWEFGRYQYSYSNLPGTGRWLGKPCDSLLVVCEGGYGDAMLFGRWLPFAKSRAKHVKMLIWDRMTAFRDWHALGVDEVIPKSAELDFGLAEYTTSWMSLPAIAGVKSVADIPQDTLNAAGTGPYQDRVGYCWRAEENSTVRRLRSLSLVDAESLASRLAAHGEVLSLVPSNTTPINSDESALCRTNHFAIPKGVTQSDDMLDGWAATAATIRSCKFVVTVDTAVAHLAGLCGVPTLILLPCASDWKWGRADNQPVDPWYGAHVRYYRNHDPLNWDIEDIALAVNETLAEVAA